jgi:hypothetical protein
MFGGFLWYSCTSTLIQEEIEDTKEVIRIVYRKKNRQHNGKKKKMNLKSKDPKVQQQEEELYQKLEAKKVSMPHKVNVSKKKVSCSV